MLLFSCSTTSVHTSPIRGRTLNGIHPIVIGHRGASGYRPEHTLASYELAIEMGADFIEPDLVASRDGVLIARHENEISGTTDVESKFPERKTKKTIDGKVIEGWFTEDFTLTEIKTLRAKERLPFRDQSYNGLYEVPTLEEVLALVRRKELEKGRVIGIYPETKHPTYFASIGLPLEDRLLRILSKNGYKGRNAPVFIQSFEISNLKKLRSKSQLRLVQLIEEADQQPYDTVANGVPRNYGDMITAEGLREIATYADGVGPWKQQILPTNPDGTLGAPTSLVRDAHAAGLMVHPYTFRKDTQYLVPAYNGDGVAEILRFMELGVDGVFTDFPDVGVAAQTKFKAKFKEEEKK